MIDQEITIKEPLAYAAIKEDTEKNNFPMPSEILTCSLLKTLAAAKPGGKFLELGTGTGLSAAWILEGMDATSQLISIDNDGSVQSIARQHLPDRRLTFVCTDGNEWISNNTDSKYDFIFADAWPGKYQLLNETLGMLEKGGIYIIDDMLPQSNWPDGHQENVDLLLDALDNRNDITLTKQNWASGIVICVKR